MVASAISVIIRRGRKSDGHQIYINVQNAGGPLLPISNSPKNDWEYLSRAIESGKDPFIVIEFQSGTVLVFDRAEARAATARIMQRLEIPINYSSDLR